MEGGAYLGVLRIELGVGKECRGVDIVGRGERNENSVVFPRDSCCVTSSEGECSCGSELEDELSRSEVESLRRLVLPMDDERFVDFLTNSSDTIK